jgi:glutaredoxin 3
MKDVVIYTTPTCHFCKEAKAFFNEKNVEYKEHDVLSDLEKRQEMVEKSGQMGVPVIMIGEDITVGFDKGRIEELLGL